MSLKKSAKNENNKDLLKMKGIDKSTASLIEKMLGDVSKTSATKQLILGASTGWITGFLSMRVGKVVAVAVGGAVILLQVANEKGYVKINWAKVNKKVDKVADAVEEKITGEGPSWIDKAERYVGRKIDKAEDMLKDRETKAKHWYSSFTDNSKCHLKEIHIFIVSFVAGVAVGIATS